MFQATLCFIFRGDPPKELLLGYKKRGFGQGKYDGFGGKLLVGESLFQAALRELHEETGLYASLPGLISMGKISFIFPNKNEWDQEVHVFIACNWRGTPTESEEMRPEWFEISQIPFDQMWDDSHLWLPHILAGERINAEFSMHPDNETVKDYRIQLI
jgi:8-oxo-dGTP diphosphatase